MDENIFGYEEQEGDERTIKTATMREQSTSERNEEEDEKMLTVTPRQVALTPQKRDAPFATLPCII